MEEPKLIWQTPENFDLTVTINLQAPSNLIHYALEILVAVCKAELQISDGKIDHDHIQKCLDAWDLEQQGMDKEDIPDLITTREYDSKKRRGSINRNPGMIAVDQEFDSDTTYNAKIIGKYIDKALAMIERWSVI